MDELFQNYKLENFQENHSLTSNIGKNKFYKKCKLKLNKVSIVIPARYGSSRYKGNLSKF